MNRKNKTYCPDDRGCRLLAQAIVRQAVLDHISALKRLPRASAAERLKETEAFFRSAYFRRLTGLSGARLIRLLRREVKNL